MYCRFFVFNPFMVLVCVQWLSIFGIPKSHANHCNHVQYTERYVYVFRSIAQFRIPFSLRHEFDIRITSSPTKTNNDTFLIELYNMFVFCLFSWHPFFTGASMFICYTFRTKQVFRATLHPSSE